MNDRPPHMNHVCDERGRRVAGEHEMKIIARFINDDRGADLIEYALLAGLISLAAAATLTTIGTDVNGILTKISDKLHDANK